MDSTCIAYLREKLQGLRATQKGQSYSQTPALQLWHTWEVTGHSRPQGREEATQDSGRWGQGGSSASVSN